VIEAIDHLRGFREALPPRLLVILGASGAGKSSFLRAGLFPRLKRDNQAFLPLPIMRSAPQLPAL
jgi:putative ribosome biogenesis GTPase RsgA